MLLFFFRMVVFRDTRKDGRPTLAILSTNEDKDADGTLLLVRKPAIGRFSSEYPLVLDPKPLKELTTYVKGKDATYLESSHHEASERSQPYPCLGRAILDGNANWEDTFTPAGEFTFIPRYWEWLEDVLGRCKTALQNANLYDAVYASLFTYDCDPNIIKAFCEIWCPETNTISIADGEASISLWDIHNLCGLPLSGTFYDEVVPSAAELESYVSQSRDNLPRSCKHLFDAFHRLNNHGKGNGYVKISDWVSFWFRGPEKHRCPKKKKARTAVSLTTQNPSGDIPTFGPWSEYHKALNELDIREGYKVETYLAALLSCWLCCFALPVREIGFIRPGTFKIASMMASGEVFCLGVPVLASIYKGLNAIASTKDPVKTSTCFPAHYVYAWIGQYFDTHSLKTRKSSLPPMVKFSGEGTMHFYNEGSSREQLRNSGHINWAANPFGKRYDETVLDDGRLVPHKFAFLMSIRSSFLTLRCQDDHIIEPYSPHRFSRQFGFHQDLPGDLVKRDKDIRLETLCNFHRTCIRYNTRAKALFPKTSEFASRVHPRYRRWWQEISGDHFDEGTRRLIQIAATTPKKRAPKKTAVEKGDSSKPKKKKIFKPPAPLTIVLDAEATVTKEPSLEVCKPISSTKGDSTSHKRSREETKDLDHYSDTDRNWKHKKVIESSVVGEASSSNKVDDNSFLVALGQSLTSFIEEFNLPSVSELSAGLPDLLALEANASNLQVAVEKVSATHEVNSQTHEQCSTPILKRPVIPEESKFDSSSILKDVARTSIMMISQKSLAKIAKLPLLDVPSIRGKGEDLFENITKLGGDPSPLRARIDQYISDVEKYLYYEARLKGSITLEARDEQIQKAEKALEVVCGAKLEQDKLVNNLRERQVHLRAKILELEAELKTVQASLPNAETEQAKMDADIDEHNKKLEDLAQLPIASDNEFKAIQVMMESIEDDRKNLKDFNWLD